MINSIRKYPSKIILFGEYAVTQGGDVLAFPLSKFCASWSTQAKEHHQQSIYDLIDHIIRNPIPHGSIDVDSIRCDLELGYYVHSDISSGYGLGSSGAFIAAIYDRYGVLDIDNMSIDMHLSNLAHLESYFHGVSSGIDPLVSYYREGIYLDENEKLSLLSTQALQLDQHYFLIDTHHPRKTSPLVHQYFQKLRSKDFQSHQKNYLRLNHEAINLQLEANYDDLQDVIRELSRWQFQHLDFTILPAQRDLWEESLNSELYTLKLCGAGGGGYILGFAQDIKAAMRALDGQDIVRL